MTEPTPLPDDLTYCPLCKCPIQRMPGPRSTPADGLKAHFKMVHKGEDVPA
jgi:hypothetical protein